MKKLSTYLLLTASLFSCTKETTEEIVVENIYWYQDEVYSQIKDNFTQVGDPVETYKSFLRAFIKDAERHGVDLSYVDVENSTIEFTSNGTIASKGFEDPTKAHLIWDEDSWNDRKLQRIGEPYKLFVMWHELGHDLLGLDHLCRSGQIMTGRHTPCRGEAEGPDEINVWGLEYSTSEDVRDFKRAVDDMFEGKEQYYIGRRTSFSSKDNTIPFTCNILE